MPNLFLHIGMPKTGTSSIQAALTENRLQLRELGFEYPEQEPDDRGKWNHHNSFRGFFSQNQAQIDLSNRFIQRVSQSTGNLILSAEGLSNWPALSPGQSIKQRLNQKREIVGRIKSAFPNHTGTVIVFTRNKRDFLNSLYHQHLRSAKKTNTPGVRSAFMERSMHLTHYEANINCWRAHFDDVRVTDYDAIQSSVTEFCRIVGLPQLPDRRENVSH